MAIKNELIQLKSDITALKAKLDDNLTAKGAVKGATLTEGINNVDTITTGGGAGIFEPLGYDNVPPNVQGDFDYAKEIYDNWDATQTSLARKFAEDKKLFYMPLVDTSKATNMSMCFYRCRSLKFIPKLDTSKVEDMSNCFGGCFNLAYISSLDTSNVTSLMSCFNSCQNLKYVSALDTSKVENMHGCFFNCNKLTEIPILDVSKNKNLESCFSDCSVLKNIKMIGNPINIYKLKNVFSGISNTGTFIHDYRYDYSKIIAELKKDGRNWEIKSNLDVKEVLSMTITADDVIGNATTTKIHYKAIVNGTDIFTNEQLVNAEITGDVISTPFAQNTSTTDSRQVEISYTYMDVTATTTITQGVYVQPTATVTLNGQWEKTEAIPNPNAELYDGIYQSVNKGKGGALDKMTINFAGMPNFELYIRSFAESNYDYCYCGQLDETIPTEYKSTKGNQQGGQALENYTKVEYQNDGGEHSVTVVYRKDGSGDSNDDRGYVFFTKK